MSGIVNESTSVIQLDTAGLQNGSAAIIYVSSTTIPGQLVSVIDATGYLSSPQSILLSTVGSATLVSGFIRQKFGYITLVSEGRNKWIPVNCNSFPTTDPITYKCLDAPNVYTSTIFGYDHMSTLDTRAAGVDVGSTVQIAGRAFLSSLNVNSYQAYLSTSVTDPRLRIWGNTKMYGSTITVGTFNARNNISTSGNFNVGGNISSKVGIIYIGGDVTTLGSIRGQRGQQTTAQALSTFGSAIFNLPVAITSSLEVAGSLSTNRLSTVHADANSMNAASSILFGSAGQAIRYTRGYLNFFGTPITTPSISTVDVTSSNATTTSNIEFQSFGPASTLSQFNISSAQILNANGSLVTSSIAGAGLRLSQLAAADTEIKHELIGTTLRLNNASYSHSTTIVYPPNTSTILGRTTIPMFWCISSTGANGTLVAPQRSMSTNLVATGILVANTLDTIRNTFTRFSLNDMRVYSSIFFSSPSSILSLKNVLINNTGGSISGTKTEIATYIDINTIQTDLISSPNTISFYGNSNFSISSAIISSLTSRTILTSSLAFTNGTLGASMAYSTINPSTPWLQASTFNMGSPPFTFTTGLGTYFSQTTFTAAKDQTAYYSVINPLAQATFLSTPYINSIAGRGAQGFTPNGLASNASIGYIASQGAIDSRNNLYFGRQLSVFLRRWPVSYRRRARPQAQRKHLRARRDSSHRRQ